MITIIIADDQKLFATSLKSVLENDDKELSVIGIAGNGKEAVDLAGQLKPDLILMDVRMPIMDGVEAVRTIHQRLPEIKIIMLTTYGDDEFVNQAILHGSAGYLLKDIEPQELIVSIRAVISGRVLFDPAVFHTFLHANLTSSNQIEPPQLESLSSHEKQILFLLAKGFSNAEIAEALFLGHQTVKNYVSNIYTKLSLKGRSKIIKFALDHYQYLENFYHRK